MIYYLLYISLKILQSLDNLLLVIPYVINVITLDVIHYKIGH